MATLTFRGSNFRTLLDTLLEAVKNTDAGKHFDIETNGVIWRAGKLTGIEALLPAYPLNPKQLRVVEQVLGPAPADAPWTCRSAAARLAHRCDDAFHRR
jgi:hypothetical protein